MPRGKKKKTDLVSEEFKSVVEASTLPELKEKIVNLSRQEGEVLKAKKDDDELQEAKEKAKELSAPYAETLKKVRSERGFVHEVLSQRGQ